MYPFGYGLTYGKCVVERMAAEVKKSAEGIFDGAEVLAEVENKGNVPTDEVLQVYVKDTETEFVPPNASLAAFTRIHLDAGEKKTICVKVDRKSFTGVDENGNRALFGSKFELYAGFSQPDEKSEKLTGCSCKKVFITI